jgi:hypothetical protein
MYDDHYNIDLVTIFSYDSILQGMLNNSFSGSNIVL